MCISLSKVLLIATLAFGISACQTASKAKPAHVEMVEAKQLEILTWTATNEVVTTTFVETYVETNCVSFTQHKGK